MSATGSTIVLMHKLSLRYGAPTIVRASYSIVPCVDYPYKIAISPRESQGMGTIYRAPTIFTESMWT